MRKTGEQIVKDIQHATHKHYSSKEKIRIVLDDLRGEDNENLAAIGPRTMVECRAVSSQGALSVVRVSGRQAAVQ
ncbi:MAG: hypothetical protein ABJO67_13005 [Pseudoruegeria sp.]